MMGTTHAMIGLAAGLTLATAVHATPEAALVLAAAAGVGGLLPDMDHRGSMINRRVPFLILLSFWFPHRTVTHSLLVVVLLATLAVAGQSLQGVALVAGYGLHIAADMLTRSGVTLFYPLGNRAYLLPKPLRLTTGGLFEALIALGVFCLLLYQARLFLL